MTMLTGQKGDSA